MSIRLAPFLSILLVLSSGVTAPSHGQDLDGLSFASKLDLYRSDYF